MLKPRHKVEFEAVFTTLRLFGEFLEPGTVEVRVDSGMMAL